MSMNLKGIKLAGIMFFCATLLLAAPGAAFAAGYLDPGSGSIIVQGLIAGMAVICRYARKIKSFFVRSNRTAG